ncbi:unnamed protein product [Schistosoma curassoni]|uniref:SOCS box domain-containing protein n=1 Tax=Schistosoma curassoni TaxID=6186 RepID=A0A183KR50_9TREM|nr:unnamed protein product [Schistosoma curassoni]
MAEHFEYNHIPAHLSSIQLYNLRNSELISELPLANSSNYDEVPLNSFRLPLGPYQENNRESNIRPSYDILSTSNSVTANFRGNAQNENQLQLGPARSSQVLFAFDPRFVNSRIAITNVDFPHGPNSHKVSSNWVPGIQATISLVKLPTWECLTSTNKLCSWSPSNRHGSPFINNATCREPTRRRRSSDANHVGGLPSPNSFSHVFPHIMSIFYSRDGYFLFTITTESRTCRCSAIGNINHSVNSLLPDVSGYSDDICNPLSSGRPTNNGTESGRTQQKNLVSTQCIESNTRYNPKNNSTSPMLAPTLPGCTTLWLTIFNSDTLERLRILRFDRSVCPIHTCPTNYLPVMSRCGSRIALITRQATEFKKQQPFISPTCLLIQPRNLNLSHHLSTSLPSPLSKVHLSSGSSPFRQMTGCSSLELSVSSYRPMAVSFESSFIGTQCNSSSSCTATVSTRTSNSSGVVVTSAGTSVVNSTVQIDVLLVYQLPPPPKLQALVRQRIRQVRKYFRYFLLCLVHYIRLSSNTNYPAYYNHT